MCGSVLTGAAGGREAFALSKGVHWEHCSSSDIPYSPGSWTELLENFAAQERTSSDTDLCGTLSPFELKKQSTGCKETLLSQHLALIFYPGMQSGGDKRKSLFL